MLPIDDADERHRVAILPSAEHSPVLPSTPLPEILINSDDYNRLLLLAEQAEPEMPYVAAYLERELGRA
ncbi:MAG TPA: hypothetical protein VL133_04745, partial [Devosia sp.]|nr:hypothetical protein [Devosia sp.]